MNAHSPSAVVVERNGYPASIGLEPLDITLWRVQTPCVIMFDKFDHEKPEKYHEGGFCPIELGDRLGDRLGGRFTVLQKLGFGGYGTVWFVGDDDEKRHSQDVALKVVAADSSQDCHSTTTVIDRLRHYEHDNQLSSVFVAELERCFHTSRNGRHLCQGFPVVGPSLARLSKDHLHYPSFLKPFACQLARALDSMHTLGVCHGGKQLRRSSLIKMLCHSALANTDKPADLTLANVALRLEQSLDDLSEADLDAIFGPPLKERIDMLFPALPSPAPSHFVRPVNLGWLPATYLSTNVWVLDFDEAFFTQDPTSELPHVPVEYMAPEAIFALENGPAADVWAFGCILVALRTTWIPFLSLMGGRPLSTALRMECMLGSLPQQWTSFSFQDGYPVHGPLEPGIGYSTVEDFQEFGSDSLKAPSDAAGC